MTDDEVEKVARALIVAEGYDPDYKLSSGSNPVWTLCAREARAAITALQQLGWQRVPEGCVVLPVEPSEEYIERLGNMVHSAEFSRSGETWPVVRSFYRAMLAASPSAPAPLSPSSDARPVSQETT